MRTGSPRGALGAWPLLLLLAAGCGRSAPPPGGDGRLTALATIGPVAWAVERIAGPRARVELLVPGGQSHEAFAPAPRQIEDLTRAAVWFRTVLPFEEALSARIARAAPHLRIVDVTAGVRMRPAEAHGHEGGEHAEGVDIHVWLDPQNMKIHARAICETLCALAPSGAEQFRANAAALASELDAVDAAIAAQLAPCKGASMYVFHPAFGYFADRYGLVQRAIEVEGKEPTPRQLAALVARARADGVRTVFVQAQYPARGARHIAASIGAEVAELDPTARDYIANLEGMAALLRAALAP